MSKPKKMGRPPLPRGESKDIQIGVRLTAEEGRKLIAVAKQLGDSPAAFVRMATREKLSDDLVAVSCKWSIEELTDKSVEFTLTYADFKCVGSGSFKVSGQSPNRLYIKIVSRTFTDATKGKGHSEFFPIFQGHADKIEKHPNPSSAAFIIVA